MDDLYIWNCIINSNFTGLNVFFESNNFPLFTNTPPILFAMAIAIFKNCEEEKIYSIFETIELHNGEIKDTKCSFGYLSLDGKWSNFYLPFSNYIYVRNMKIIDFINKLLEKDPHNLKLIKFKEYVTNKYQNLNNSCIITIY